MSRKGNRLDNSVMGDFFGHLKEETHHHEYTSTNAFTSEPEDYIQCYSHERISLTPDGLGPMQYRTQTIAA